MPYRCYPIDFEGSRQGQSTVSSNISNNCDLTLVLLVLALVPRPRLNLIRYFGVLAPNAKLRRLVVPCRSDGESNDNTEQEDPALTPRQHISWARLLKRVFNIDIQICPHCQGNLKILASIEDPPTIVKILKHLGLPTRAPPRARARHPDGFEFN